MKSVLEPLGVGGTSILVKMRLSVFVPDNIHSTDAMICAEGLVLELGSSLAGSDVPPAHSSSPVLTPPASGPGALLPPPSL
jgi:hypothetical protein